jgi:hypothetical protein
MLPGVASNSAGFLPYMPPYKTPDFPTSAHAARMYKPIRALMISDVSIVLSKKLLSMRQIISKFATPAIRGTSRIQKTYATR